MMGYKEIYRRYRQQILDGRLKPGERVPAIRVLASELQVARKTVEAAYEILTGEGYFVSQGAKYTHECREYQRYCNLGWEYGEPEDAGAAYDLWNHAHTATLEDYRLKGNFEDLYHPDASDDY